MKKIDKNSISVLNLDDAQSFVILLIPMLTIIFAALTFKSRYEYLEWVLIGTPVLLILFTIKFFVSIVENFFFYKNSRYTLTEEFLLIKKSGLTLSESTIPLKRVQHVDIVQTFYSRLYDLYQVNIYTAGDSHNISYVTREEADRIKEQVSSFVIEMSEVENE